LAQMPVSVVKQLQPEEWVYATHKDNRRADQSIWVSTPGLRTHTHFDSDHNMFIQLLGKKRFVLWAPNQTQKMCPFPRLHPLWHKSRADFEQPDTTLLACATYGETEALAVDVGPGDVLYVPPFWWHSSLVLVPQIHSEGTQHCEPVKMAPGPEQSLLALAKHWLFMPSVQHIEPVHVFPGPLQPLMVPATHVMSGGTQHFVPVKDTEEPLQPLPVPGTHWAGPFAKQYVPVQKRPSDALQPPIVPAAGVQSCGTQH